MCSPGVADCRCFIFVSVSQLLFISLGNIFDPLFLITPCDILIPWKYCTSPSVWHAHLYLYIECETFLSARSSFT